ncbi:MAG: class I SAM-dependent methyltransferase [Defluviitaleaceae bacterium]|nr:class I SAM-dependent methyltransferase [Defluviitaleaceae bacterium]
MITLDKRLVFDNIPDEYDKWRPTYVPELYDDVLSYSGIDENCRVLEIGIGTGKATLPFLEKNCRITAIELGANLADYSRRKFADYKNLEIIVADFEKYDCPEETFDLVYAACAFHWIPEEIGYLKVFKLLKRGGAFARFANWQQRDKKNKSLYNAIQEIYSKYMPGTAKPDYTEDECRRTAEIALNYGFADVSYKMYHRKRTYDAADYVSLQRTHGGHADMPDDKWTLFSGEIKDAIRNNGGKINVYDVMELQLAKKPSKKSEKE